MIFNLRKHMKNQKGFTLVELMVVMAIIGILAAIAIPKMSGSTAAAKDSKLVADLATLDSALSMYYASNGNVYPTDLDTLKTNNLIKEVPKGADGSAITYTCTTPFQEYTLQGTKSDGTSKATSQNSKEATTNNGGTGGGTTK